MRALTIFCSYDVITASLPCTTFMALTPKTAVLQVRLDPELLRKYQEACEARHSTVSQSLREHMYAEVAGYESHLAKQRLKAEALEKFGKK